MSPADKPTTISLCPSETQPLLPKATQPSQPLLGYIFMLGSALCHATMTFLIRLASTQHSFPPPATALVRSGISISLSVLYLLFFTNIRSILHGLTRSNYFALAMRGLLGSAGVFGLIWALSFIPVGNAVTIFFSTPAITTVLCAIFLKETVHLLDCLALGVCFGGVLLVSQPSYVSHATAVAIPHATLGSLIALTAAFLSSSGYTIVRMTRLRVHFMLNVTSFGLTMGLFGLIFAKREDVAQLFGNRTGLLLNVAAAVAGFGSQSFLNMSLQKSPAGPAMVIRTLSVPLSYILGLVFLGERASALTLVGVGMVMGAAAFIGVRAAMRKRKQVLVGEGRS